MILIGDCISRLSEIASESIQCCVTSPPYWGLRDYGVGGQLGLEETPEQYIGNMRMVFEQVHRILKPDGTLWLNLGDSYCGGGNNRGARSDFKKSTKQASNRGAKGQASKYGVHNFKSETVKPKDLMGIPWRMAFALQADGWYLRQDIIWHKPNPMPESVRDRCTKAHEYIFLLSKSDRYYFDVDAIKEPAAKGWAGSQFHTGKTGEHQLGRAQKVRQREKPVGDSAVDAKTRGFGNYCGDAKDGMRQKRSVWTVTTKPFRGAHFATFPPDLIEPCILAGSKHGDTVLDPFFGAGTTGLVAEKHGRKWLGIELNPDYAKIAEDRIAKARPSLKEPA